MAETPLRVAVIGSGIAGLSCAWLLSQDPQRRYAVSLFEQAASLGMDQHSIALPGTDERIDVPMRVFSDAYYPNLVRMYEAVGIQIHAENYATTYCSADGSAYFRYQNFLLGDLSIPVLPWQFLFRWSTIHLVYDWVRLTSRHAKIARVRSLDRSVTIDEYLRMHSFSESFMNRLFYPVFTVICTCSREAMEMYPAAIVLEYLARRNLRGVRRTTQRCGVVAAQLSRDCKNVHVNVTVESIHLGAAAEKHRIRFRAIPTSNATDAAAATQEQEFDHVVFATPAHVPLRLLVADDDPAYRQQLKEILEQFSYEKSRVLVHSSPALMPRRRCDWSAANIILRPSSSSAGRTPAGMTTMWMNVHRNPSPEDPRRRMDAASPSVPDLFQTWNPAFVPDESLVLQDVVMERPLVNRRSLAAIEQLAAVQGKRRTWFIGAHTLYGMPLLETGVCSGLAAAEAISRGTNMRPWPLPDLVAQKDERDRVLWTFLLLLAAVWIIGGALSLGD